MRNDFANLKDLGYTTSNGLVQHLNQAENNVERLYIEEAKKLKIPVDAVFFRRFYKDTSTDKKPIPHFSTPSVCIFKQSDSFFNTDPHKALHAELWSAGKTEIYILLGDSRIDIINARKPAKRTSGADVTLDDKDLLLVQSAIKDFDGKRFYAHLFGSGTFWEQSDFQEKIDGNSNPYAFLLDYLMEVRKQLIKDRTIQLADSTIDKLLITCILIKFLEEIKDDNGKHTLKELYKKYDLKTETFEEGLQKGVCIEILADLSKEFNGKIFDTFSKREQTEINNANLAPIAKFLSAEIDVTTNQGFLWKQYSFKHLPAEVISAIYENFIQAEAERNGERKKGVVYTPLHLVNLLIDEVMPLDQPELFKDNHFKVLDPACGSGVFLVAAYKRMLQWWAINNYHETNQIAYPNKTIAQQILEQNIYGVDIEEVAALVSIFGLTTAFLDKLTPKEIWNNLQFKNLSKENILGLNFIDWAKAAKKRKEKFSLVIGNPPFNPSSKGTISDDELMDLVGKKVPGNKLSLKFFEAGLYFGDKVCMILPANNFLYGVNSQNYRKDIFTDFTVEKIYDFTHLRRDLFHKTADTPVLAVFAKDTPSKKQAIKHIIVKRELLSEKKMRFEIDYYDKHQVKWEWAVDDAKQFIWKTNLLGGGQLFHLIYRLSLLETLGGFLKDKEKKANWIYSSGYKVNHKNRERVPADFITDRITIKPKTFNEFGQYEEIVESSELFAEPRKKALYEDPHIIFKLVLEKSSSRIPMAFVEQYLCFNITFVGISSPKEDKGVLFEIYNRLYKNKAFSNLYRAFILGISPRVVVSHETSILKEDIDNLPYPKNEKHLTLSKEEKIIVNDVLKYYRHLGKAISKNSAGKILHDPITTEELQSYGETYCYALNDIYAEDGKSWQIGQIVHSPTFIRYQFGFGKNGGLKRETTEISETALSTLLNNSVSNQGVLHKRIIRQYQHLDGYDCVFFIKPKTRRYWLESIALRDADDTFVDLKKAGF